MNNTSKTRNEKYIQYLNNVNSPFFKINSTISQSQEDISKVTLKKVENSKELALKNKPKLNKKNLKGSYLNLIKFTNNLLTLKKSNTLDRVEDKLLSSSLSQNSILVDAQQTATASQDNRKLVQGTSHTSQKSLFNILIEKSLKRDKANKKREYLILKKQRRNKTSFDAQKNIPYLNRYRLGVSSLLKSIYNFDVFLAKSQKIVYTFNRSKVKLIKNLENILHDAFSSMSSLISRPVLEITGSKIIIHLFFFFKNIRRNKKFLRKRAKNFFNKNNTNLRSKKIMTSSGSLQSKGPNKFKNLTSQRNKNLLTSLGSQKKSKFFKKQNKRYRGRFFRKLRFLQRYTQVLGYLAQILSKYLHKNVQFELIKLHYPINESHILAKSIGILGNKIRRRFKYFVNASFKSAKIDNPSNYNRKRNINKSFLHNASSSITGIKMKLGGRILAQRIVPRFTSQTFQEGSLTRSNASFVTSSRFTNKNRKGTYSITVSIGHRFF